VAFWPEEVLDWRITEVAGVFDFALKSKVAFVILSVTQVVCT
jgi:hypothetical protein